GSCARGAGRSAGVERRIGRRRGPPRPGPDAVPPSVAPPGRPLLLHGPHGDGEAKFASGGTARVDDAHKLAFAAPDAASCAEYSCASVFVRTGNDERSAIVRTS